MDGERVGFVVGELRAKYVAAAVAVNDLMQTCGRISADLAHYAGTVESDVRAAGEGRGPAGDPQVRPDDAP